VNFCILALDFYEYKTYIFILLINILGMQFNTLKMLTAVSPGHYLIQFYQHTLTMFFNTTSL